MKSPFEDIQFPQYRKYSNNKNFFKILSPKEFVEIQVIGSKKLHRTVVATQFPEMNLIIDLVTLASEFILRSDREEFEGMKN
jgi:hypothetical protein